MSLFEYDKNIDVNYLCGVDEAGRGPLAGDVFAAAVVLKKGAVIEGLNDSKKLTEKKREALFDVVIENCESYCIARASIEEIESVNILGATFLAMRRAVEGLSLKPDKILIDGNRDPRIDGNVQCVIKGDATSASIAAASILAKVARDRYMLDVAKEYPQYQFEKHKGYGTKLHYEMIEKYGISPVHRPSFLKKILQPTQRTKAQDTGDNGERLVCEGLLQNGYEILEQNYHSADGEIDIIARNRKYIAFVEVKTRKQGSMVDGFESVTKQKQIKIIKTARKYLREHYTPLQPRFDVASVCRETGKVNYLANAFGVD